MDKRESWSDIIDESEECESWDELAACTRGQMSEVVDLNQARLEKVIKDSGAPVLGAPVPKGGLVVSVLACSNCGSTAFSLGHHDPMTGKALNIVICAVCRNQIVSLRWRDVNLEPEPAA